MTDILFFVFAAVAAGGAFGVVLQKNPVGSLLFMVATLGSVAGIFVLFEAHFLAAIQVMVYAGAIMVLFLFVIMLLNLGHDYRRDLTRGLGMILAFGVTGLMAGLLARQFRGAEEGLSLAHVPGPEAMDALLAEKGAIGALAIPLFTDYMLAFELTGILLLVALVGAIAIAKRRA
ncbi:MAG: NADH-quinone oxidoreductase subunit J [Gemmatimonadales bacterium]|nr:MAG: NADH-quinone oxidoreductase subunit J [Gemmatimonadales bacterium]